MSDDTTILRADRWVDIDAGELRTPAVIVVEGERIVAVNPAELPSTATEIDLGDVTLLPGLMDMELNMLLGGPSGGNPRSDVQDDPAFRTLRGTLNCRTTLLAGFTTVRNLGLFVKTGGYLLDVALARAVDNGWIDGPRIVPAGHAITPTGGHLDPTMFQRLGPDIMPLSVEEGIANGVPEVRKAVRYQIKYGARVIKISASGGVMSHSGLAGAQQYSDEELAAIVDEAHRAGLKVAAHAHGDAGIRACIRAGVDCIEHGSLASDETIQMMVEHGTFLVPTSYLSEGLDVSRAAPELQAKAAEVFPRARAMLGKAIVAGVKIACGTDAPAIPHGDNAKELWAMVDRGMTPMQALQAATIMSAELIAVDDRGRLAPGLLADIIAVPGDPSEDITTTQDVRFVMKGGRVYKGATTDAEIPDDANEPAWRQRAVSRSLNAARSRAEQRVQRFLDAAFELIDEKGTTEFTIQEVIDRSKQSLRGFYQYFDGKDELLLALFEETVREATDDLRVLVASAPEPLERLHAFTIRLHEWCDPSETPRKRGAHNRRPIMEFSVQLAVNHPERVKAAMEPISRMMIEVVDAANSAGAIDVADTRRAAALVQQTVMYSWFGNRLVEKPRLRLTADATWEFCLRGLGG